METLETLAAGRYALGPVLGRGGMSVVRRASDTVLGRDVAVKLFREDLEPSEAARVETEMAMLASLSHPGLVCVHDAGTEQIAGGLAQPYLVMELVDGPTLAACCLDGSLPPERVAQLGADIAEALAHVHAGGVVHRDVKPANILLSPAGAKLADFGIARIVDSARQTGTGLTVGTAPYLAPEQVQGRDVGPAADVYALGLVLLECLTGRREYTGGPVEVALARLHRSPQVPADLAEPFPALLTAMTATDPADRPTAGAVAARLRGEASVAAAPTQSLAVPEPTRVLRTVPRPVPRVVREGAPRRRRNRLLAGTAVVLAMLVLAAVSLGGHGGSTPPPAGTTPLERHLTQLDQAVHP